MAKNHRKRADRARRKQEAKRFQGKALHSSDRTPSYGQQPDGGVRFGEDQRRAERAHSGGHGERTSGGQIYETDQGYGPTHAGGQGYGGPKTPDTNPDMGDEEFGGIEGYRGQGAAPQHANISRAEGQYLGRGGYAEEQPPGLAPPDANSEREGGRSRVPANDRRADR
jgi:hypothetical protein